MLSILSFETSLREKIERNRKKVRTKNVNQTIFKYLAQNFLYFERTFRKWDYFCLNGLIC